MALQATPDGHTSRIFFTVTDGSTARHSDAGGDLKVGQVIQQARAKAAGGSVVQALAVPTPFAGDDMTIDECRAQSSAFSGNGYGKSRFVACQAHGLHFQKKDCILGIFCVITGEAFVDVTDIEYTQNRGRTVDVVQLFNNWLLLGDIEGMTLSANVTCSPRVNSGPCSPFLLSGPYVQSLAAWAAEGSITSRFYDFSQPASSGWGPDLLSYAALQWQFVAPGAEDPSVTGPDSLFRCDSANYLAGNAGEGCVFPWVTETVFFSVSQSGEAANNILTALYHPDETVPEKPGKVIPGRPGTQPLHRTRDAMLIRAHRSFAVATCEQFFGNYRQGGKQCDEFPFASTLEGATPDDNFAVEPIPAHDNESGGAVLVNFWTQRRIIADDTDHINDPFFVDVRP